MTLTLGAVLAAGLVGAASVTQVPYVSLQPGPTFDTLGNAGTESGRPVVEVSGRTTFDPTGQLDLTTVSVAQGLTLGEAVLGWFSRDEAVVPRELIYPSDQSDEEVAQENRQQMQASQSTAVTAALRFLGIRSEVVTVSEVPDGPSSGVLEDGDVLLKVDGEAVLDGGDLRRRIGLRQPGQDVRITFRRDGATREVTITTTSSPHSSGNPDEPRRAVIGVVTDVTPDSDVDVTINLADVGGPSAGLMFALAIVDKLDKVDLTGGRHVAGTGEIDAEGLVGPIGGISQKLVGARRAGATVFLVPADNCEEALLSPPDGLQLVKVGTLREALVALRVIRDGGEPETC